MFFKKEPLNTYVIEVKGMRCSMCESHINNIIYKNFNAKKVKSSHLKNQTIVQSKEELDIKKLKEVITATGYEVGEIRRE